MQEVVEKWWIAPVRFRFPESVRKGFIHRKGESLGLTASTDFMADGERIPIQESKV